MLHKHFTSFSNRYSYMRMSQISGKIDGQPMFKILEQVQELEKMGKRIAHFELGEPDFDTPEHITNACIESLQSGNTHYAPSGGINILKVAAADATLKSRGFNPDIKQILVTPGANAIIYMAIKCLADVGDDILVPDPGFPTYFTAAAACGVNTVSLNLNIDNGFSLDPEEVEKKITPKTKLLILNSPSNPTGAVLSEDKIRKIFELCKKNKIYILSDEIYARMIFSKEKFFSPSILDECKEMTIILNGFSKAFAMTGWRLGIAIGPELVIDKMSLLVSTINSCVPPFIQEAGIAALKGDQKIVENMINEYAKRADFLANGLNEINGITCRKADGAMYVFADIRGTGLSSEQFAEKALHQCGVAVTPGLYFGNNGEGFVRFSVVRGLDDIDFALKNLKEYFNEKNGC